MHIAHTFLPKRTFPMPPVSFSATADSLPMPPFARFHSNPVSKSRADTHTTAPHAGHTPPNVPAGPAPPGDAPHPSTASPLPVAGRSTGCRGGELSDAR